jgi:hypothetical protein
MKLSEKNKKNQFELKKNLNSNLNLRGKNTVGKKKRMSGL